MKRYIDAEKIEIRVPYGYNNDGELLVPIAAVKQSIARTPTEDVEEVVRCRACKYYTVQNGVRFCRHKAGLVSTQPNNYCGYGERKEQA